MGRKRTPPVTISANQGVTEVPHQDGLPAFQRHIDVRGQNLLTRVFFVTPLIEEIEDTVRLNKSEETAIGVIGASMPYMSGARVSTPLFEHCIANGFSDYFATDFVRLAVKYLQGKHLERASVRCFNLALREFAVFLANHRERPLALADINKQHFLDYLAACESDHRTTSKASFSHVLAWFKNYEVTPLSNWLASVSFKGRQRRNPLQEHTSELAETRDYSDVVMYQLLALFIEGFQRRIGYLKHYENLSEANMPQDWLYPGRKKRFLPGGKRGQKESWISETSQLLSKWLTDEEEGYQVLIDHHIMHHKVGLLKRHSSGAFRGGIRTSLLDNPRTSFVPLVPKFLETMARWHGYKYPSSTTFISFYINKKTANEVNLVINQIGWCLANLLMMQTGVNKEVALTIPSKAENGESILTRGDTLFISKGGATEIELYGIKSRTGKAPRKVIPITIAKNSPLHEMLLEYEKTVKVDFNGPFFEFNKSFKDAWSTAGGLSNMERIYPVIDEGGIPLVSLDSTRFRKVFASGQLLDRMKDIKDGNELAEMLREDLNHGNLDLTLTNYLLKSTVGRSVIDIAIATITTEKLLEGLRFRGKIALKESSTIKKRVFLCDCEDPKNPSHDVAIAEECRHYDLCLGCERSIITRFHLPYICARIMQYEQARQLDPNIWPAMYEDRWSIAHDALEKYIFTDKKHGRQLVNEAWNAAKEGGVSLPPIIVSNRI